MCEPISGTTAAMMAMAAASAAITYTATEDNAKNQQKSINDAYELAASAAQDNYRQTDSAAQQQKSERALEATKERSRLKVIAGESGALGGLSADRQMNESSFNESIDLATIESNRQNANLQTEREAKVGRINAANQMASVQRGSLLGAGLQISSAYVSSEASLARANGVGKPALLTRKYSGTPLASNLA